MFKQLESATPTPMQPNANDNKPIRLKRSHERPLQFKGVKIAEATTKDHDSNRWTDVEVYQSEHDRVIVSDTHRTRWQGEEDTFTVHVCEALFGHGGEAEAITWIEAHCPSLASELAEDLDVAETLEA